jgi:hypothetical protein
VPNYYSRSSQAEMLGIPYVLVGDSCLRTDLSQVFVCVALPSSILANWSMPATVGPSLQMASVTLTPAQIHALRGNQIPLGPNPGAGNAILPVVFFLQYVFGTTPYVVTSTSGSIGTSLMLANDNPFVEFGGTGFLDQTSSQFITQAPESEVGPLNTTAGPIVIGNLGADDFSSGDGTLTITMYYVLQPIA